MQSHIRECLLRFYAATSGKDYETVLREYRGIPEPNDPPRMISSALYNQIETTVAQIMQGNNDV